MNLSVRPLSSKYGAIPASPNFNNVFESNIEPIDEEIDFAYLVLIASKSSDSLSYNSTRAARLPVSCVLAFLNVSDEDPDVEISAYWVLRSFLNFLFSSLDL